MNHFKYKIWIAISGLVMIVLFGLMIWGSVALVREIRTRRLRDILESVWGGEPR